MRRLMAAPLLLLACSNARPVDGYRHRSYIHPDGILDPASPDFHGKQIENAGWDFSTCQKCHGEDFKGGAAGVSCYSCHDQGGPTGCTTCHGQPPKTGAHQRHVVDQKLDCTTCHVKPMVYTDAGHLDGKVTVTLEKGSYQDDQRCSGTYCHGSTLNDAKASNTTPLWTGGADQAKCGTCHGLGPAGHVSTRCADCHPKQPDGLGPKHIDGVVSLGDESGSCNACHSVTPTSGAHIGHLTAPLGLRKPLACQDCHQLPAGPNDPAHPVTAVASGCNKCHGATPPSFTDPPSAAFCGTCHGVPPADAAHAGNFTLNDCASCHPSTMEPTGGFVPGGTHINGVVDAQ
jgi:predicted CxxxxCH...CXXCH cytochrome family protein